ncbi:1065_t:CDS:2, partial [Racocetra persica]
QMKAIFPEISRTCGNDSVPFRIPGKEVKKGEEKKENETEIKKSVASLGKRDEENINVDGGGELQIVINRKDLERYSTINSGGKKGAISAYDNHQIGFTPTSGSNSDLPDKKTYSPKKDNSQEGKNNPLTDAEKQQILQYFLKN